ncbi:MAG: carboxypeptidase-like regulatory domain-containing protein [Pyrinomonadaceae bacterium]
MRHRKLVFTALFGLLLTYTAHSQAIDPDLVSAGTKADQGLRGGPKADPLSPQVMGRVTDFAGRSVKAADVRFVGVEFDEVVSVRTNVFGFYQVTNLTPGRSYFVSVSHKRYLFLIADTPVTVSDEPVKLDFAGELAR